MFVEMPIITKLRDDYNEVFSGKNVRNNPFSFINEKNKKNRLFMPKEIIKTKNIQANQTYQKQNFKPKRNLIIIEMESIELQSLGIYNKFFPTMMPFLSNFSHRGTFFESVFQQPYTLWTAGSIFATHCGLPHVVSDQFFFIMRDNKITQWPNLPCISKHFQNVGYNMYFSSSGDLTLMGIRNYFIQSGFHFEDSLIHNIAHDYDFYFFMIEKLFKKKIVDNAKYDKKFLNNFEIKEPFVYIMNNQDTHPFFYLDNRCTMDPKKERVENCFNCYDFLLKNFFDVFEKSDLFNRTDVFLYGDHLSYGRLKKVFQSPRNLLMFFPYLEKRVIEKVVTIYDIAPTLLDMMGIEYFPPYPYGANMFDDKVIGAFPVKDEFNFIYNKILKQSNDDLKCFQTDNCDDQWEYYRTRQFIYRRKKNDNYIN